MLQPEGQIKDSQAQRNKHLQPAIVSSLSLHLPELQLVSETEKVTELIFHLPFFSILFLYLTLVLPLCPSIIHSLFIFTLLSVLLPLKEQNSKSKKRGTQSAHTHIHSQSIQTTAKKHQCEHKLVHEHTKTNTYLLSVCSCSDPQLVMGEQTGRTSDGGVCGLLCEEEKCLWGARGGCFCLWAVTDQGRANTVRKNWVQSEKDNEAELISLTWTQNEENIKCDQIQH